MDCSVIVDENRLEYSAPATAPPKVADGISQRHRGLTFLKINDHDLCLQRTRVGKVNLFQLWKLKTPQGNGSSLTKRINDGISKWNRVHSFGLANGDTPRIVVDNRFSTMSEADAMLKLKTAMAVNGTEGFDDAIFISSVGAVTRLSA